MSHSQEHHDHEPCCSHSDCHHPQLTSTDRMTPTAAITITTANESNPHPNPDSPHHVSSVLDRHVHSPVSKLPSSTQAMNSSQRHSKPTIIAIVLEDETTTNVDVYDVHGKVKTFQSKDLQAGNKLCFSTHGKDVDSLLTPCFDEEGGHGEPEEGCFCGVPTAHIHAHVRKDSCDLLKGDSCDSKLDDVDAENEDVAHLAQVTFHPMESNDSIASQLSNHSARKKMMGSNGGVRLRVPLAVVSCNSKELEKSLSECGSKVSETYHSSRHQLFKVKHDDHEDLLVHNELTGKITLEHECQECDGTDVHGTLNLINKRTWDKRHHGSDGNAHGSNADSNFRMNFYEVPKVPMKVLDLLSDLFSMETDRVAVVHDIMPKSPHRCKSSSSAFGILPGLENIVSTPLEENDVRSTFHVSGICCAAEIPLIKTILEPIRGVSAVNVVTTTKLVYVNHNPNILSANDIVNALNKEKFGATLKKDGKVPSTAPKTIGTGRSSFFVSDICCASEIPAINQIVEPLDGVSAVLVNVANKIVYVTHNTQRISASAIQKALQTNKFACQIITDYPEASVSPTVMSKYVESTFLFSDMFDDRTAVEIKRMLTSRFDKERLSHCEVHLPSKTIKIDHNPKLLFASTLLECMRMENYSVALTIDGFEEGIWSIGEDDQVDDHKVVLQWPVVFSGIFWIVSMLNLIDENWEPVKYIALLSVVLGIPKIALKAIMTLRRCQFDTNCMMLFAVIGAIALQEYSEAAAVTFLFSISDWLESLSTSRARNALSAIVRLRPERAQVKDPVTEKFVTVHASSVAVGSIVSVRTGDKIPCDGVVIMGDSVVDESSLTGESRPVKKIPGDDVSGGTINAGLAQLLIKTVSTVDNSAVARLIRLVEEAQANRSETEKLMDSFAKRYTPMVVLTAICMCTFPWIAGRDVGRDWTEIGLVTIVIACPCALIISTPVTYVAGLAAAAQKGIIVKGGSHLEALGRVKTIAFDKTGTLTEGNFQLLDLHTLGSISRQEALQYLYAVEAHASHPLASAIISAAKSENASFPETWKIIDHRDIEGEGVSASVNGKQIFVGNFRLFDRLGYTDRLPVVALNLSKKWSETGGSVGLMAIDGSFACLYCVADRIRDEAKDVIASLSSIGIDCTMLTGDISKSALAIGLSVGLLSHQIKSQLLPNEKLDVIQRLIHDKSAVEDSNKKILSCKRPGLILMCGDGINDAPALAAADIGVAMGGGAALAMETADITLLDSNLMKLLYVIRLGRRVTRTIIENVIFSFLAKAVVMGFTFAGYSSLWAAIASDVGAMLIVTANGMKLLPSKKSIENKSGFDAFELRNGRQIGCLTKAPNQDPEVGSDLFPVAVMHEKT